MGGARSGVPCKQNARTDVRRESGKKPGRIREERNAMRIRRSVFRAGRHEQVMTPPREDIYREDAKLHDPTTCRDCGATYHMGRWTWSAGPEDADVASCP